LLNPLPAAGRVGAAVRQSSGLFRTRAVKVRAPCLCGGGRWSDETAVGSDERARRAMLVLSGASLVGYSPTAEKAVHSEGLEIVAGVQVTNALVSRQSIPSTNRIFP
jgi:hypothetical protein